MVRSATEWERMRAGSQTGRALGLIRSLAVYHAVPLRQRLLVADRWMTGDKLGDALETPPAQRRSGDIYARLGTEETGDAGGLRPPFSE